ncbi:MAG: anthranilate synthase component I family protein [Phycisphaerales bacterium]|nr:anthranilate synthase component I family protein [Phycisphaerales bacterium]
MPPVPYIRLDSSHPTAARDWTTPARAPTHQLICHGSTTRLTGLGQKTWADPLSALHWMAGYFPCPGRWIGYLSYDLGRWFEVLTTTTPDDLDLPLFAFAFAPDHNPTLPAGSTEPIIPAPAIAPAGLQSNFSRSAYLSAVQRAIDYIAAGDIFQVNLAQRLSLPTTLPALSIYQHLLTHTPAWYGGLLDFGDFALICNSPELFFHLTPDRRVTTRPIKGTRPRAAEMETELTHSPKDQAELAMIVDLLRNDLGRICQIGSIHVTQPRTIETHPTVYHGAATIHGQLRSDITFVDLLRAIFPGGSITGAPKIRAMQIIDELEPHRRGPYCGAIGYLDHRGACAFNIAIRTMILKQGVAHISVGGGIVADSQPASEYDETLAKARALLAALGVNLNQVD